MQQFAKPENALKRADELCNVGQKENALVALHDVLSSKRHRMWQPSIEDVILRFIDLCVELRKGKAAKDGLVQYRFICQQINVASMETVLRHFMELADKATQAALESAEKLISDKVANLLDFDDLEAEETPESLMLATIGGSTDSKKRTDRQIVTPSLKFLWESFRTVLDILRNNSKLEELYREATARAFGFCKKYKRSVEFRRLCDMLRNHIQSQTRVDPRWKDREPPTAESFQMHLETRFAQLDTAIEMELWQEAYRTVEDVHMLLLLMKKTPKPSSMVAYHAQLARIFWVADNRLFHAYAISRQLSISKTQKAAPPAEETTRLASAAVLAALAIPPASPVLDVNLLEYDLEHEKTKRMAQMLSFPLTASRATLMEELRAKEVFDDASPDVRELALLIEQPLPPLDLAAKAAPILERLTGEGSQFAQYDKALRELVGLRVLQQMERLYLTIKIDHLAKAIPLLSWQQIETLVLWAVKRDLLTLRIDYKHQRLNQQPSKADAAASSEVRDSLSSFASALDAVDRQLRSAEISRRKAEVRARLYGSIGAGIEEEHQKILSRRLIIERRKEEQERVTMEEEKEKARLKHIKQREEEHEERSRLASEALRRDAEREAKERAEEEQAQMRKLAEQMAEQRKAMKVTKKKGGDPATKVETSVEKLAEKDRNELMREQRELMMDERTEFEKRLETMAKRHDHMERARREEEASLLQERYKAQQADDQRAHAEQAALEVEQRKANRQHDLEEKSRFARMAAAAGSFDEALLAKKREAHLLVVAEWREDQARRKEEARLEKEREEAAARAREEEIEQVILFLHPDTHFSHMSHTPSPHISGFNSFLTRRGERRRRRRRGGSRRRRRPCARRRPPRRSASASPSASASRRRSSRRSSARRRSTSRPRGWPSARRWARAGRRMTTTTSCRR